MKALKSFFFSFGQNKICTYSVKVNLRRHLDKSLIYNALYGLNHKIYISHAVSALFLLKLISSFLRNLFQMERKLFDESTPYLSIYVRSSFFYLEFYFDIK